MLLLLPCLTIKNSRHRLFRLQRCCVIVIVNRLVNLNVVRCDVSAFMPCDLVMHVVRNTKTTLLIFTHLIPNQVCIGLHFRNLVYFGLFRSYVHFCELEHTLLLLGTVVLLNRAVALRWSWRMHTRKRTTTFVRCDCRSKSFFWNQV